MARHELAKVIGALTVAHEGGNIADSRVDSMRI